MRLSSCLLSLAIAVLVSIHPASNEVVDSVSQCNPEFLHMGQAPVFPGILENGNVLQQNRYKLICQTLENKQRYLTLYDTKNKIPVFSAYKYKWKKDCCKRDPSWRIEPQLEDPRDDKEMRIDKGGNYQHQAGNKDYDQGKVLHKGHMFPVSLANSDDDAKATFTLTNAVPQYVACNSGKWRVVEKEIKLMIERCPAKEGFVVTGAIASCNYPNIYSPRVNIPKDIWSAFICFDKNKHDGVGKAYMVSNIKEKCQRQDLTLNELNENLGHGVLIFPGMTAKEKITKSLMSEDS